MPVVSPSELHPHRVYFTELDRATYSQVAWTLEDVAGLQLQIERKLKALALVKGHVVVAASHLFESELGRGIVLAHPELVASGIVVPALRSDFTSCGAFLEAKRADPSVEEARLYSGTPQDEMAALLDGSALLVSWHPGETTGWFRTRLLADLDDDRSLLRSALREQQALLGASLRTGLAQLGNPSRNDVCHLANQAGDKRAWEVVSAYVDFLYYLSGARAVQSEGLLPQENIVDFGLGEMAGRRTALSDLQIFFKLFAGVVKSVTSMHLPADLLDVLTFKDAVDLHQIAVSRRVTDLYNAIQARTKEALEIHDPERLVLLMEELEVYESELSAAYEAELRRELTTRLHWQKGAEVGRIAHTVTSLFVDPYGWADAAKSIVMSTLRLLGARSWAEGIESSIQNAMGATRRLVEGRPQGRSALLDFMEVLFERYATRARGRLTGY